jgi:hypothetical protein
MGARHKWAPPLWRKCHRPSAKREGAALGGRCWQIVLASGRFVAYFGSE